MEQHSAVISYFTKLPFHFSLNNEVQIARLECCQTCSKSKELYTTYFYATVVYIYIYIYPAISFHTDFPTLTPHFDLQLKFMSTYTTPA